MAGEDADPTLMLQMSITVTNYSQTNPGASKTDQAVGNGYWRLRLEGADAKARSLAATEEGSCFATRCHLRSQVLC